MENFDDLISYKLILDYDNFDVVLHDNIYYHVDKENNNVMTELTLIAKLSFTILNEPRWCDYFALFNCDISGEKVTDNDINYYWFNFVG